MEMRWEQIIGAAKRENNQKRSFVVVNRWQGKHVPVQPTKALQMMALLVEPLKRQAETPCLVIGFAETATAVGLAVAQALDCPCMTTTREALQDVGYLYFSEAHSHATEQKLVKDDLEHSLSWVKRIIFVEDEITTGRTILQLVRLLRKTYGRQCPAFTAASVLNGMGAEELAIFNQEQISCVYLYKTDPAFYEAQVQQYKTLGNSYDLRTVSADLSAAPFVYAGALELRRLQKPAAIKAQCAALYGLIRQQIPLQPKGRLLLLGTEEFMYPALAAGQMLEQDGYQVWCHATTRSPIVPIVEQGYPLQARWQLHSFYETERNTYLYNLQAYENVVIVSDAALTANKGLENLTAALRKCGNENIYAVEWRRL